jgi:hypothetical protein
MRALERLRKKNGASLNQAAIDSLGRGLGVADEEPPDNGISTLAGTWTEPELRAFEQTTAVFEKVDDELWK